VWFAPGEDDRGLWDAEPLLVEGTLVVVRHKQAVCPGGLLSQR
jgi:hypothetical protein